MAETAITYQPIDTPKPVAQSIWIVDSGPHRALGLSMPVRMTVVRLANGDLMLHSPTRHTEPLARALGDIGPIRHLIAPNIAHWSYMKDWQRAFPEATTWAAPNLRDRAAVKRSGLRLDHDLSNTAPEAWADEIAQAVVPGLAGFREIAFLHRPSRTLILTDLIENLEPGKLDTITRLAMQLAGATAPTGKAAIYLRMAVLPRRAEAQAALAPLLADNPERVIFAHGTWFERDAAARARQSLSWLLH